MQTGQRGRPANLAERTRRRKPTCYETFGQCPLVSGARRAGAKRKRPIRQLGPNAGVISPGSATFSMTLIPEPTTTDGFATIPTEPGIEPGTYTLSVVIRDRQSGRRTVRNTIFTLWDEP